MDKLNYEVIYKDLNDQSAAVQAELATLDKEMTQTIAWRKSWLKTAFMKLTRQYDRRIKKDQKQLIINMRKSEELAAKQNGLHKLISHVRGCESKNLTPFRKDGIIVFAINERNALKKIKKNRV